MESTRFSVVLVCGLAVSISVSASAPVAMPGPQDSVSMFAPKALGVFARVVKNGVNVEADTAYGGTVTSSPPGTVSFVANDGSAYEVGFTLPADTGYAYKGLALKALSGVPGRLTVNTRISPDSSRQTVIVMAQAQLVAGFTWQRSLAPILVDLGGGVRLEQGGAGSIVPVFLTTPGGKHRLLPGKPSVITSGMHTYTVFVHTSMYQQTPARFEGGDSPRGYILRALVVSN